MILEFFELLCVRFRSSFLLLDSLAQQNRIFTKAAAELILM